MALDAERLVNNVLKIAALPAVALKFSEAIKNPLTSNQELDNIISEDTALASKILMIANSALFNFPSKIETISKAITIIGFKQLNEIIVSCSIVGMFKHIPQEVINMDQFWRHNIAVATTARILAARRREQNIEKFFTAGLLHDIGKLVLFIEKPGLMLEVIEKCKESRELMYKVEQEVLGIDHARIGAMLLKKWKLPESIVSSVYYHHMPSVTTGDVINPSIVHVADIISHALQYGSSGEDFVPRLNDKAWSALSLDVDVVASVIEQLEVQHTEAVKYILGEA